MPFTSLAWSWVLRRQVTKGDVQADLQVNIAPGKLPFLTGKDRLPSIIFRSYVKLEACISPERIAVNIHGGGFSYPPKKSLGFRGCILRDFSSQTFPAAFFKQGWQQQIVDVASQ